ncbi:hypothetical protein STEG23_029458 [Scotinomys teguina]
MSHTSQVIGIAAAYNPSTWEAEMGSLDTFAYPLHFDEASSHTIQYPRVITGQRAEGGLWRYLENRTLAAVKSSSPSNYDKLFFKVFSHNTFMAAELDGILSCSFGSTGLALHMLLQFIDEVDVEWPNL